MKSLLLILLILSSTSALARRRVMITAFEPFGGRSQNGSQLVAQELARNHNDQSVEYVACILPVEYRRAPVKAQECYDRLDPKPDMVISTGEGGCDIRVESQGVNYANTPFLSDNSGETLSDYVLDDRAIPSETLTLPIHDMICAVDGVHAGPPVTPSTSAGFYVCNSTAFQLSRFFKPRQIPYGFVHLPVAESCNSSTSETANKFNQMIRAGVNALELRAGPDGRLPCGLPNVSLLEEVSPMLSIARRTCELGVRQQLQNLLRPSEHGLNRNLQGDIQTSGMGERSGN